MADKVTEIIKPSHGLFYMENAGGCSPEHLENPPSMAADERQPSCFALEEEKGEGWKGGGATGPAIKKEARPTL
jgi:hypothetical protein